MKKIYLLTILFGLLSANQASAQTFSAWGLASNGTEYDTIFNYEDTLRFDFNGLQPGIYTNARLVVVTAGDFGNGSEYVDIYLPTDQYFASTSPNSNGDCTTDSTELSIPMATVISWGSTVSIYCITTPDVDMFCGEQRVKMRLEYEYCPFGTPSPYADFTASDFEICPLDGNQVLTGNIPGGTFSGPNVTGNIFNPSGLPAGNYDITFTGTDALGCTTEITKSIKILSTLPEISELICENSTPQVTTTHPAIYSQNINLSSALDTTTTFTFPAITQSPSVFYYAPYADNGIFTLDELFTTNSVTVDHNSLTGDDRSGIAITDSTIYVIGDNSTAVYDLDLTPSSGISIPIVNDGLFSDLEAMKLYTLYDTISNSYPNSTSYFVFNAIAEVNADLTIGATITPLSQTLFLTNNTYPVMILAGKGQLIISDGDNEFYKIELATGNVSIMGVHNISPYWSENWAIWGNAGFDGTYDIAYYRDGNTGTVVAYNFGTNTTTSLSPITDYSDMATMTYHPGNGRFYGHYEGSSSIFGGSSETLFYTDVEATDLLPGAIGCTNTITYTFNSVDLGPDTTVCDYNGALVLEAGFGYQSYTWNGVNNNWNVFPAQQTGTYTLEVVDSINCTLTDNIVVTFDDCASIEENTAANFTVFPVPNNGIFTISMAGQYSATALEIVSMTGQVIYETSIENGVSELEVKLNAAPGTYLVRMLSNEGKSERLIIIQ